MTQVIETQMRGTATDIIYMAPERCTEQHYEWLARIVRRTGRWPSIEAVSSCAYGQPWLDRETVVDEGIAPAIIDAFAAHVAWIAEQIVTADEQLVDEITALRHYTSRPPRIVAPSTAEITRRVRCYARLLREGTVTATPPPQSITVFAALVTEERPVTADQAMRDAVCRSWALEQRVLPSGPGFVDAGHLTVVRTQVRSNSAWAREARLGSAFAYTESAWSV